ncbi:prepilin-type N-terminal cleavage/methylation domain-containing protein [Rhodanobacter glycinis]|uniref:type IV pilin protein n=1 Tax=Rhodanobacter glycinis TaxID=582702 RepID=UPI001125FAA2|nr:type IV pilin protein [Rhodanobacter glycinis]TPG51099.1 prepilin-type N-terminal cleavage/methylation domain-containing protein [Rhodanobacter glycinis]
MARVRGFTLLELMIVVVIIAILAAIAIPTYSRYAIRAHRVDGQEWLLRIANAQERFYATNNHYGALTELGYTNPLSEKGYYSVSMDPAAASTTQVFTATAAPVGGQAKDDCQSLTINNAGVKASFGTTTNGSCW